MDEVAPMKNNKKDTRHLIEPTDPTSFVDSIIVPDDVDMSDSQSVRRAALMVRKKESRD